MVGQSQMHVMFDCPFVFSNHDDESFLPVKGELLESLGEVSLKAQN